MPAFRTLIDGHARFRQDAYPQARARFDTLAAEGQAPPVMVISCCDSRVDPATIFDAGPGELFVLRNVANIVPPYEEGGGRHGVSAAIEFAVCVLEVRYVVVMGHGQCGGITASLSGRDLGVPGQSFIDDWIDLVAPARDRVLASGTADPQQALEQAVVRLSLDNLRTFPFVAERVADGRLRLQGCWYAIASGELAVLDHASGTFAPALPATIA